MLTELIAYDALRSKPPTKKDKALSLIAIGLSIVGLVVASIAILLLVVGMVATTLG